MAKKKKKAKSLPKLKAEAQRHFNAYIRQRDKDLPCISSDKYDHFKQAGHYFPVKTHDGLRFDEDNCHGETAYSNCFDEGHLIGYHDNLLARIGEDRFKALYQRAADYKQNGNKWSRSDIQEIITKYKNKLK